MSFEQIPFKTNPNFHFNSTVVQNSESLAGNCNFEVLKNKKDKKVYIYNSYFNIKDPFEKENLIQIISLEDGKVVKVLEGHEDRVLNIRYFYNKETEKEYLVSADKKCKIIVWDITDDYKLLKKIECKYQGFIYSNVLVFRNNSIFLITSSITNEPAKIVDITKDEAPREIGSTKDLTIFFMETYKKNSKDYLILCGKSKIRIIDLFPEDEPFIKDFDTSKDQEVNMYGLIYKYDGKDYFISSCTYGGILIIDLENMQQKGEMKIFDGCNLYNIVQWNEKYLLLLDSEKKKILVMDLKDNRIISKTAFKELYHPRYMKKVIHPVYGEAILTVDISWNINLFTHGKITKFSI